MELKEGAEMVKKIIVVILLVLIVVGLIAARFRIHDIHALEYKGSELTEFTKGYGFDDIYETWDISLPLIESVEDALNKKILESRVVVPSYKVQLFALNKGTKEIIYFNAFCFAFYKETETYWKSKLVGILDGDRCTFYGEFDVENKEITSFHF